MGEKKEGAYANTLAKIQVTANFLMEDMRRNFLPKFIEICKETPCWCPSSCYKTVNLYLEELKNIKIVFFLIQELFRWPNSPK